jgi:FtsZ-binding cell division protein ZapB
MIEIEIISLLNKYKNCTTDFDKNKFKNSIKRLIFENPGEFDKFISSSSLDSETINFLKSLEELSDKENSSSENSSSSVSNNELSSDLEKIKQVYNVWKENFVNNNRVPNEGCENVLNEMINFYAPNRFFVLKKVLEIKDDNDFESFKNMLNNYVRKYFAEKISKYYKSDEYNNLGFFAKRSKKREILNILDEMSNYVFDEKKILEVLE